MSRRTIETFYAAFRQLDGAAMQACYAPQAAFQDEAFTLQGREEIGAMWRMLCDVTRAKGLDVWQLDYQVLDEHHAHWDAHYRFSATGRMVLNHIDASFEFDNTGLILRHRDRFDFWAWSRQALGLPGLILGWTPMLRAKVQAQAAKNLAAYRAKHPS
ncbi:MAG: nuclear transport factor 2 family protein [Burkholderiales bacterium]|nr:nuclear transport factor 2 family protein [Burkholderiales bacterium]